MFSFTKKQTVHTIHTVSFGGQPGQYPTALIGGLFFKDAPNLKKAKQSIDLMFQLSKKTGNPGIVDFFVKKESYLEDVIDIIEKTMPSPYPFSIDVTDPGIKVDALKLLSEKNLLDRTIYNSIHIGITDEEKEALVKFTPAMAIIVAFNPKDKSPDGKIEVLETSAHMLSHGLIDLASTVGIKKILVDTAALAPGDNSGAAIAAIPVIKEEYGYPTGCAIHNVVEKSRWLCDFSDARKNVDIASNLTIPLFGGDFAIYGPLEHAPKVFPLIAWQDILISEYTENYFGIEPVKHHPRRNLLR